jgi:hypothetical protein
VRTVFQVNDETDKFPEIKCLVFIPGVEGEPGHGQEGKVQGPYLIDPDLAWSFYVLKIYETKLNSCRGQHHVVSGAIIRQFLPIFPPSVFSFFWHCARLFLHLRRFLRYYSNFTPAKAVASEDYRQT